MDEMKEIVAGGAMIAAAIGTLVARWSETDPKNPLWKRLARVFDLTQIFDSTRKLDG